jgi:hypothetical protein
MGPSSGNGGLVAGGDIGTDSQSTCDEGSDEEHADAEDQSS